MFVCGPLVPTFPQQGDAASSGGSWNKETCLGRGQVQEQGVLRPAKERTSSGWQIEVCNWFLTCVVGSGLRKSVRTGVNQALGG